MKGKTLKKAIAKTIATVMTLAVTVGGVSGVSFAAGYSDKLLAFDHENDVLSMVMDAAEELTEDPYESLIVSNYEPYLPVYEKDDASSEVVGKLYPASYGEIVEKGDQWTKITSGQVTGYVLTKDVSFGEEAETLAKEIGTKVVKVMTKELNIRSDANFYSEIIASGKTDDTFIIVPEGWEYDAKKESFVPADTQEGSDETSEEDLEKAKEPTVDEIIAPIIDEEGNEWYRIYLDDTYYGYVFGDYVAVEYQLEQALTPEEAMELDKSDVVDTVTEKPTDTAPYAPPQTQAPQTNAPQTQAPQTDAPQTGAPQTDAPQTDAPQTDVPQTPGTDAPETETPNTDTQAPETEAPQTDAPQTEVPQTEAPQTEVPQTETEVPETETPQTEDPGVSEDEAYLLACLVYCEAGNQSYDGMLAVANVVLNRVKSPDFPNTITDVIYQGNGAQFHPVSNGALANALANGPSDACVQAANDALAGANNIGNYLYFGYSAPSNASGSIQIGVITFYNYPWSR